MKVWRRVAAGLEAAAAVLTGAGLVALHSGPLRFSVFGAIISVRNVSRPLMAAAILIAVRLWMLRQRQRRIASINSIARIVSGSLIVAGVVGWLAHLSPTCGGADSYGYVSAAERLLDGDVVHPEPLAAALPFPNPITAACPLGYVPSGRTPNASVPAYPLGLPALMAISIAAFGREAPFFVAPILGIVLLVAAYKVGRTWYDDVHAALLGCALLALHPLVFTYSLQPMSDVPAAAALMITVYALSRTPPRPAMAGLAAAAALIIRPALAPAALALIVIPISRLRQRGIAPALWYSAVVAAGAIFQAWTQWYLYGNMFSSGYGAVAGLFSVETSLINLRSYAYWGFRTFGPVWLASLAIGAIASTHTPRLTVLALAVGVGAPYLFYRPYDHWETLRFLLPAIAVATIVSAWGLLTVARRLAGGAGGALIAALVAVAVAGTWTSWLSSNQVFTLPEHEARHRVVGEIVGRTTPADAVILALQHSGSVRYYAGRETLNWDQIPSGAFQPTVESLRSRGHAVYVLIDSREEQAMFRARHGDALTSGGWLPAGQWRNVQMFEAPQGSSQIRP